MKVLLIAEKPNLAKDIENVYRKMNFKDDITFTALAGHVLSLKYPGEYDKKWDKWDLGNLPIIPSKFEYKLDGGKAHFYNRIKDELNSGKYDYVINACDAGREGEHIFFSVYNQTKSKLPVKRLWISDTTDESIKKGLNNLIDGSDKDLMNLKDASFLRSYFDWLIGMNLSRAVSLKTSATVPVGRVMTPTLAIIVNRENEIKNFKPENYYTIDVSFNGYTGAYIDKKSRGTRINDKKVADKVLSEIKKEGNVLSVEEKLITNFAPELYSLLTLQKDANKVFSYTAAETLEIAQRLYDELKLISYPRTESSVLSTNMVKDMKPLLKSLKNVTGYDKLIESILKDDKYVDSVLAKKTYVDNTKLTDHHAIIPTNTKFDIAKLSEREKNLYGLIFKRFISIFMKPYQFNRTTVIIESGGHLIKVDGKALVSKGFKAIYKEDEKEVLLPKLKVDDIVGIKNKKLSTKQTNPPSRYNDSSLLDAMANAGRMVDDKAMKDILRKTKGIGTSATRDSFIEKLINNKMIYREKKIIKPSDFGMSVINALKGKDIISPELTAMWEEKLGKVEDNKLTHDEFYNEMLNYTKIQTKEMINDVNEKLDDGKGKKEKKVLGKCPKCGTDVVNGNKFYICEEYKKSCDFLVGKRILGASIGIRDVKDILAGKETKKKTFTWKSGKKGEASLKYSKENNKVEFVF